MLVLSRSYPSDLLPTLGLWVERPTQLLAERHAVQVVAPSPWSPPLPAVGPLRQYVRFRRIPHQETRAGIEIHRTRFLAGPGRSLYAYEAGAQELGMRATVRRLRAAFPFDVIHAHMVYPEGAVAHRLSRRHGVPFVVSEHAPWTDAWFRSGRVRREALAAARAASLLLPVSTAVERTMATFGVEGDHVRVVPVGVDTGLFRPTRAAERDPDRILFAGWINYTKGIDVLLRAMTLIRQRDDRARLVLVGGALYRHTRLQEEELRRMADSLGLGDRVEFVGRLPQRDVARLMAGSAVVVLPSRAESFGAVLVEALASGTPVVATRCGGPEDIVSDEVGRLVPVEQPEALAQALLAVLRGPARFEPDRLRDFAASRFGWDRVVDRLHEAYLDVTGTARPTALPLEVSG